MPTAKPRLQVTLTVSQHELLKRLAKLQKRSSASIVSELFDSMFPVLERVAVVLQAAVRAQESAKEGLMRSTEQAERELRPHLAAALGQLDLLTMDFDAAASDPGRRSGAELPGSGSPRLVTRGSGLEGTTHTNHARAIRRKAKSGRRGPVRAIRAKKGGKRR